MNCDKKQSNSVCMWVESFIITLDSQQYCKVIIFSSTKWKELDVYLLLAIYQIIKIINFQHYTGEIIAQIATKLELKIINIKGKTMNNTTAKAKKYNMIMWKLSRLK